ncbi:hypothetical protein BC835DRAFT_397088 [Cytidiella melzeri]|nr:hypothetical protein BC835DRAFT_397088 [Cytidiella melzeri]
MTVEKETSAETCEPGYVAAISETSMDTTLQEGTNDTILDHNATNTLGSPWVSPHDAIAKDDILHTSGPSTNSNILSTSESGGLSSHIPTPVNIVSVNPVASIHSASHKTPSCMHEAAVSPRSTDTGLMSHGSTLLADQSMVAQSESFSNFGISPEKHEALLDSTCNSSGSRCSSTARTTVAAPTDDEVPRTDFSAEPDFSDVVDKRGDRELAHIMSSSSPRPLPCVQDVFMPCSPDCSDTYMLQSLPDHSPSKSLANLEQLEVHYTQSTALEVNASGSIGRPSVKEDVELPSDLVSRMEDQDFAPPDSPSGSQPGNGSPTHDAESSQPVISAEVSASYEEHIFDIHGSSTAVSFPATKTSDSDSKTVNTPANISPFKHYHVFALPAAQPASAPDLSSQSAVSWPAEKASIETTSSNSHSALASPFAVDKHTTASLQLLSAAPSSSHSSDSALPITDLAPSTTEPEPALTSDNASGTSAVDSQEKSTICAEAAIADSIVTPIASPALMYPEPAYNRSPNTERGAERAPQAEATPAACSFDLPSSEPLENAIDVNIPMEQTSSRLEHAPFMQDPDLCISSASPYVLNDPVDDSVPPNTSTAKSGNEYEFIVCSDELRTDSAGHVHHVFIEEVSPTDEETRFDDPLSPGLPSSSPPSSQLAVQMLPSVEADTMQLEKGINREYMDMDDTLPPSSPIISSSQPRASSPDLIFSSSPPDLSLVSPPSSPQLHCVADEKVDIVEREIRLEARLDLVQDSKESSTVLGKRKAEDPAGNVHSKITKLEDTLSLPPPPNPKRPTQASQKKQYRKLIKPFRSPLVNYEDVLAGKDAVYTSGHSRSQSLDVPSASDRDDLSASEKPILTEEPLSDANLMPTATKNRTANVAKPFRCPVSMSSLIATDPNGSASTSAGTFSTPSCSISGVQAAPTIQNLQARIQKLKQAIKIKAEHNGDDDAKKLEVLVTKWRTVGRDVAWLVWDTVKDLEPGAGPGVLPAKGGWDEGENPFGGVKGKRGGGGFGGGWGYDDGKAGNRGGFASGWGWDEKGGDGGKGDGGEVGSGEAMDVEENEREVPAHTLGTMLRHMGIDPDTLGWDEDEGDFVGEA